MKFVIYCLLAVCAFKAVFADKLYDDIVKLNKTYVDEIKQIMDPLYSTIKNEMKEAEKKGINTGGENGCLGSSAILIDSYVDPRFDNLRKCCDKAIEKKSIEYAKSCCAKAVDGFPEEAKEVHATARQCIKNCSHTDCSKIENL